MLEWTHKDLTKDSSFSKEVTQLFLKDKDNIVAAGFDTETDGLHIILSKPFLFQFGWCTTEGKGMTFAIDLEEMGEKGREMIREWNKLAAQTPIYLAHNVKFDQHMTKNIGCEYKGYNLSDTQFWIRWASDAVPTDRGGAPLQLKPFAIRYVDRSAKDMDKQIQEARKNIAKRYNNQLKQFTGMTIGQLDEFFNDRTNTYDELPEQARKGFEYWRQNCLPDYLKNIERTVETDDIRYTDVDRNIVRYYGHLDIVWLLECYIVAKRIVDIRGNAKVIERENAQIYPLLRMERVGLKADYEYMVESRQKLKVYLRQRRHDLCEMYGGEIKVSQREKIKDFITAQGYALEGTTGDELKLLADTLKCETPGLPIIDFIETVLELRTLEKWYSTYIVRLMNNYTPETGRIYTQINQSGAVSGRVTCDFQQFPKDGIKTKDGEEIFHPRRLVLAQDGDYDALVFLDYSQIELRLQAAYTILVAGGDMNLCRAYSPFKCHTKEGRAYDPFDQWCIDHAYDTDWYQDEDNEPWTPTDVHGATTRKAFPEVDPETEPEKFHRLRYVGKRVNFAKNYGATYACIRSFFPEYSEEKCKEIDAAYYAAFPGVKDYHQWVYAQASREPYLENLCGARYYGASGHNLINYLIQGSGAYMLKAKIVEVDKYLIEHGYKSKFAMQIHDELMFYKHKDDPPELFFELKNILQNFEGSVMPIISDMEVSTTTWCDKYEVEELKDFYQ